jgi:hypothetical protein
MHNSFSFSYFCNSFSLLHHQDCICSHPWKHHLPPRCCIH